MIQVTQFRFETTHTKNTMSRKIPEGFRKVTRKAVGSMQKHVAPEGTGRIPEICPEAKHIGNNLGNQRGNMVASVFVLA